MTTQEMRDEVAAIREDLKALTRDKGQSEKVATANPDWAKRETAGLRLQVIDRLTVSNLVDSVDELVSAADKLYRWVAGD